MRLALLAGSSILLAACATQAPTDGKPKGVAQFANDARLGEEVDRICFASSISGFHDATDDTVVISKGFILDQAQQLAVDATTSCLTRGDHIIASDSIAGFHDDSGFGVQRCRVKSLHKWNRKAEAPAATEESE